MHSRTNDNDMFRGFNNEGDDNKTPTILKRSNQPSVIPACARTVSVKLCVDFIASNQSRANMSLVELFVAVLLDHNRLQPIGTVVPTRWPASLLCFLRTVVKRRNK